MSRQQKARVADLRSHIAARRRSRADLASGKLLAAGHRSAEIEALENRVLLSVVETLTPDSGGLSGLPGNESGLVLSADPQVTTLADETDPNDGLMSLREAIASANSGETISFASSLAGGTIVLNGTELAISNTDLTIQGLGAGLLTISGNPDPALYSRVFNLSLSTVSISGLTITGGHAISDAVGGNGGAIYDSFSTLAVSDSTFSGNTAAGSGGAVYSSSDTTVTISNSTFSGNSAAGDGGAIADGLAALTVTSSIFTGNSASGYGGAVYNRLGAMTVASSIFSDNSASNSGGAIRSSGYNNSLTISDSTLNDNTSGGLGGAVSVSMGWLTISNSALGGNSAVSGGAISNSEGPLKISNSTLSGNTSSSSGGAIFSNYTVLTLNNSTLSGNSATGNGTSEYGGAIYCNDGGFGGSATLNNSTLSGNSASAGGAIYSTGRESRLTLNNSTLSGNSASVDGGAVGNYDHSTAAAYNSILSGNTGNGAANDVAGVLNPASAHNLIGVGGGLTNGVNGNLVGITDPKLGPLQDNGGTTWTMALLAGNLALDAGDNSLIPPGVNYDQRGAGHDRIVHGTVDIGAYEDSLPTDITLSNSSVAENQPAGTVIGTFSTADPDMGDTFAYALVAGTGSADNGSFTIVGNALRTAASFNYEVKNSYSIRVRTTDSGGLSFEKSLTISVSDVDEIAPTVTAVYVKGSAWSSGFLSFLAGNTSGSSSTYGFAIPVGSGAAQLQTLPWRNLDRISIAFSEDVSVAQAQFAIAGSVGSYSVSGFAYNATDHVATWSLSAAIGPDKLYIALPGTGTTPVTDTAGNALDGEWTNPTSYSQVGATDTFPSGNGTAGGNFAFRFDVLPGDSTGGSLGKVNVADIAQTKSRSSLPETASSYRSDFDGNNLINVADIAYVKSKSSIYSLPVNPPILPVFGPVFSSVSLLWRRGDSLLGNT